ncbi:MAG: hypothetical protein IPJ77_07385 [Planctomycetes bacterium]|nr:hypothetical protein [Planctomycetota bacterium]
MDQVESSTHPNPDDIQSMVLRELRRKPGQKRKELARNLDYDLPVVIAAAEHLCLAGKVRKHGSGRHRRYVVSSNEDVATVRDENVNVPAVNRPVSQSSVVVANPSVVRGGKEIVLTLLAAIVCSAILWYSTLGEHDVALIVFVGACAVCAILLDGLGLVRDRESFKFGRVEALFAFCVIMSAGQIAREAYRQSHESQRELAESRDREERIEREQRTTNAVLQAIQQQSLAMRPREWSVEIWISRDWVQADSSDEIKCESIRSELTGPNDVSENVEWGDVAVTYKRTGGGRGGSGGLYHVSSARAEFENGGGYSYISDFTHFEIALPAIILDSKTKGCQVVFSDGVRRWRKDISYKSRSGQELVKRDLDVVIPLVLTH